MSRLGRSAVYVLLPYVGLSATPASLYDESLAIASIGLAALLLVQVRTTRNSLDCALAWVALWAVASVLGAPFVPAFHFLGGLARGAL